MISMDGDLVPVRGDRLHGLRVSLCNTPARKESGFDAALFENAQDPPYARTGSILGLGKIFMVHFAIRERDNELSALKVETQKNRNPTPIGPENLSSGVVCRDHFIFSLLTDDIARLLCLACL
jgi:hypothetical protein